MQTYSVVIILKGQFILYMKAIRMVESEEVSEVIVSAVSRKGYALSGKVIRPTEVIVARPV